MRNCLGIIALLCLLASCASGKSVSRDQKADCELGLGQNEAVYEANDAVQDIKDVEREEREEYFRRTVTDPLIENVNP